MIDLDIYAKTSLPAKEADLILKYFKKYEFKRLWHVKEFFEKIKEKVDWINNDYEKAELISIAPKFVDALKEVEPSFKDLLEVVYKNLDIVSAFQSEFNFKSGAHRGYCPACGKRELYVPDQGEAYSIVCSRKSECKYSDSIYGYLTSYGNFSQKGALEKLASLAGVDLVEYQKSLEIHTSCSAKEVDYKTTKKNLEERINKKAPTVKKIEYLRFDAFKKYQKVDFNKMLKMYKAVDEEGNPKMNNRQKFMMIVSFIYYYSLQTNQTGKALYYKSRGISIHNLPSLKSKIQQIVDEVGYLDYKSDIPALIKSLTNTFPTEDLIEFGVINGSDHKVPYSFKHFSEEGFCIVPNMDLYTNMVTGLKLRNTKLASWQCSSMKEPELSYGRIANPLPYGLKRDAFMKRSTFRLQEGSVDSFSIPEGNNTCDVSIPGVTGISKEALGLFQGMNCEIWYDQDDAGQIAAWGAIRFKLKNKTFELDHIGQSIRAEFNRIKDKAIVFKEEDNNKVTFEDIMIPNNEANAMRIKTIETMLNRRKLEFKKVTVLGMKQELEKAGALSAIVKTWDKHSLGGDCNEVLQNGKTNSIIN